MRSALCALSVALATSAALAQSSASYRLTDHALDAGGHTVRGSVLRSTGYRISLDTIADPVGRARLSGPPFRLESGFVAPYRPPGEVQNLRAKSDRVTLSWGHEPSSGSYSLYRDSLSDPGGGACLQRDINDVAASDAQVPAAGTALAYPVAVRDRLREEGTAGYASSGEERSLSAPCP
jgi:hypothetical protein